jgi:hypothetical protein
MVYAIFAIILQPFKPSARGLPPNRLSVLYSSPEAFNALGLDRSMPPLNKPPFGCAI